MRFRAVVVTGVLLYCGHGSAQTAGPRQTSTTKPIDSVVVYAPGSSSCGAWLDARDGATKNKSDVRHLRFEAFLFGFASAYNWYVGDAPSAKGVLGETDVYGQWAYLDKYCRDNPTHAFVAAVSDLLKHLKELQR